jgi:hypothetical protein
MPTLLEQERIREIIKRFDEIEQESRHLRTKIEQSRRRRAEFPARAEAPSSFERAVDAG